MLHCATLYLDKIHRDVRTLLRGDKQWYGTVSRIHRVTTIIHPLLLFPPRMMTATMVATEPYSFPRDNQVESRMLTYRNNTKISFLVDVFSIFFWLDGWGKFYHFSKEGKLISINNNVLLSKKTHTKQLLFVQTLAYCTTILYPYSQ
jgi:hypothetical protein